MRLIDSHTGGEPTRVLIEGLPELPGSVHDRQSALRDEHDWIRSSVCREPRSSEVAVGAALFPPSVPGCLADVVFFNNVGYLGMCGHGTIGVCSTLAWLGRAKEGGHRLNTVAGVVECEIHTPNTASFVNVESYRQHKDIRVGDVVGDVAYGGNWFFLVKDGGPPVEQGRVKELTEFTVWLMTELAARGVTGGRGVPIDHIEVFGPSSVADSRNFVLCPGGQYDRSPCGTGTSAKLACLFEDGKLAPNQVWRQESITGSIFEGSACGSLRGVRPTIKGQAYVTADSQLVFQDDDPFRHGL